MTDINKQKFLAELGKLLTFMYDEDRQDALAAYSRMFDHARDEQLLLQFLVSPTRQAVVIARAYNARERKLQVNSQSREGHLDDAASRDYMHVLDELEAQAAEHNILTSETSEAQLSIFDEALPPKELEYQPFTAQSVELSEDKPRHEEATPAAVEAQAEPAQAVEPAAETIADAESGSEAEKPTDKADGEAAASAEADPVNTAQNPPKADESTKQDKADTAAESSAESAEAAPVNTVQNPPRADDSARQDKADTAAEGGAAEPAPNSGTAEAVELGGDDVDAFLSEFSISNDELALDAPAEEAQAVQAAAVVLDNGESKADKRRDAREEKADKRRAAKEARQEAGKAARPAALEKRPARNDKPAPAPVKAGQSGQPLEAVEIKTRKPVIPLLILYTIIAVPVVALCVLILLIPTLLCLAVSALAVIVGCATLTSAFSAFTMFSDVMVVLGASLLTLALGLLFLWLFVWLIGGAIAGLINAIIKLGGKWCYKEVPTV